jgi:hypothetical protein
VRALLFEGDATHEQHDFCFLQYNSFTLVDFPYETRDLRLLALALSSWILGLVNLVVVEHRSFFKN